MTTRLVVDVIGTPVPQGSKVANRHGHGVRDVNAKTLRPWRAEVAAATAAAMLADGWETLDTPAEVTIVFHHARPAYHYGTGRNTGRLKPAAPCWKATAPDIDKLTRAILDALTTARAIRDDARVARLVVEDRYADGHTGARITVATLTDPVPAATHPPTAGTGTTEGLF